MNRQSSSSDWFFPLSEAPVLVPVTHRGVTRDVPVPRKKALVAADTGQNFNTMTDFESHPPPSARFRRDRPTLERRAGTWLRQFHAAAAQPGFSLSAQLDILTKQAAGGATTGRTATAVGLT